MVASYIPRTLVANKGAPDERLITEDQIAILGAPTIILGDPGLGKTELTLSLEKLPGVRRVTGGTFYRNNDPNRFAVSRGTILVIDGLDEITASSGSSSMDEVLKKLSQIAYPNFIISCRSADWQGSTDRYKIGADYGAEPITLQLQPFSRQDAVHFLSSFEEGLDAEEILHQLDERDLDDFYQNPLTLTLIAEVAIHGQGLPDSRADLFSRACELLAREENRAHLRSQAAQSALDALLSSAGAIFTHLLLSGSLGVADLHRSGVPDGYIPKGELGDISNATLGAAALKTRLFRSIGENLFIPYHRVIAEFLGAKWLGKRLSDGLSERRVFQSLTFAGGVPTALRGLHAWLAHFNSKVASRCIQADPYGVLRYGEPNKLPLERARLLLASLASLAEDDPYFRSEDWGKRAVAGIARPELKDPIVELIKRPNRPLQLSTLILEALSESQLTNEIAPELLALVLNVNASYAERINAAEALISSSVRIDWTSAVGDLRSRPSNENRRVGLEIIALNFGAGFTGVQIADALLDYLGPLVAGDANRYVSAVDYRLVKRLSSSQSAEVLDAMAARRATTGGPNDWPFGSKLSRTVNRLVVKAIDREACPSVARLWSWMKLSNAHRGYSSDEGRQIREFFRENVTLRRQVQRLAFIDDQIEGAPWMAIVHTLPSINEGLALTVEDTTEFLMEIGSKEKISKYDAELWASLVRCKQLSAGLVDTIERTIRIGIERHAELKRQWDELTAPPKRDWEKEQSEYAHKERRRRLKRFEKDRDRFNSVREKIASGAVIGALNTMANAYLNRYAELDHDAQPVERLREWLGDDLTKAALAGFAAVLSRDDLPTARKIAEIHSENKEWIVEPIMMCGVLEMVRARHSLNELSPAISSAVLASWWEGPGFDSSELANDTEQQLEQAVFPSNDAVEEFLTSVMEPYIQARRDRVPGLYRLPRDDRFKHVAGKLALHWLGKNPTALPATQWALFETAIEHANSEDVTALITDRVRNLSNLERETRQMWIAAAFLMDFPRSQAVVSAFCDEDPNHLWSVRNVVRPDRSAPWKPVTAHQLEFVISKFAPHWPPAPHPSTSWGATQIPGMHPILLGRALPRLALIKATMLG
jgi:hypothetical protein